MYCRSCGKQIADQSKFCYLCGAQQELASAAAPASDFTETGARKLRRSTTDRVFGGVCGGLGEYFDLDPVIIRVLWALTVILGGFGILAYIVCWIVIDEARPGVYAAQAAPMVAPASSRKRLRRSVTDVKWAGVCGGIAAHLGVDSTVVRLIWVVVSVFLLAIVGGLLAYLVMWMVMPPAEREGEGTGQPLAHSS